MKGKMRHQKIKYLVVACLICTLMFGVAVYAIYTNSLQTQRTIAPFYSASGDKFSSNYLLNVDNSNKNVKTIFVESDSLNPTVPVTVCNYLQGKQSWPSNSTIVYSVTIRFVKLNGTTYETVDAAYLTSNSYTGSGYEVTIKRNGSNVATLNSSTVSYTYNTGGGYTLTPNTISSDTYIITFGTDFAPNRSTNNLFVEMLVSTSSLSEPITLRGIFDADLLSSLGASSQWTGSFSDSTTPLPYTYDGFNYVISGTGKGNVTITWDTSKVEISYASLIELAAISSSAVVQPNSITFPVDSSENSRYEIQFYKVVGSSGITSSSTWSDMNGYITLNYARTE